MPEQLVFDSLHYPGTYEVELDGEIRSIHFNGLAVRFVVDILVPATKGGGGACCGEKVQILGRRRHEIYESARLMSPWRPFHTIETYTLCILLAVVKMEAFWGW